MGTRDEAIAATTAKRQGRTRRTYGGKVYATSSVLVSLLLQFWAWGVLSAPIVQRIAAACVSEVEASGGIPSDTLVALQTIGTSGAHPNVCRRDILRKFTDKFDMFKPLNVKVPCVPVKQLGDWLVSWTYTPIMMPNEMFEHIWEYFPETFKELLGDGLSSFWDQVMFKTMWAIIETCKIRITLITSTRVFARDLFASTML